MCIDNIYEHPFENFVLRIIKDLVLCKQIMDLKVLINNW